MRLLSASDVPYGEGGVNRPERTTRHAAEGLVGTSALHLNHNRKASITFFLRQVVGHSKGRIRGPARCGPQFQRPGGSPPWSSASWPVTPAAQQPPGKPGVRPRDAVLHRFWVAQPRALQSPSGDLTAAPEPSIVI